jgi:two-component system sensor histidine kinase BaeS
MKLFPKLFLTFFLTASLLLIGMVVLVNWSFRRGLENYLHQTELEKLALIVPALEDAYQQAGSWPELRKHRRWLRGRVRHALRNDGTPSQPLGARPPRRPQHRAARTLPQSFLLSRLRVLDADKQVIIGGPANAAEAETLRPLRRDGEIIGWIALRRAHHISNQLALAFQSQQHWNFIIIAVSGLVLSIGVAFWLARQLSRPLQQITQAARRLGQGEYQTRVDLKSRDELGQLAMDFNHLALSLERHEQSRRQWIADISHELRTPLAVLRGEIEALQDGVRQANISALQSLHHESLNLGKLVDDLYELALSDAGALDYRKEALDLTEILAQTVDAFSPRFAAQDLRLNNQVSASFQILADTRRLQQLFSNILENTLRYTDDGGELRISAVKLSDQVTLRFQDSAPGVPTQDLNKLFERLYRVDKSRSRASGGAGLGLSICRNIAEAHGGAIYAAASPLGGVEIVLELPCLK